MIPQLIPETLDKLRSFLPEPLANKVSTTMVFEDAVTIANHLRSLREALSRYLPIFYMERLGKDPEADQVGGQFREGAVVFADVSGFTAMSEKLSGMGKEGAEEITTIVNAYFGRMLQISELYRGELLKFGGDALLIFFEGEDGPQRALFASRTMQEAIADFSTVETSQGIFKIQISIGIGTGPILFANLGSSESKDLIPIGRALTTMASAEGLAEAGQIVVDQATHLTTLELGKYQRLEDGFWLLKDVVVEGTPVTESFQRKRTTLELKEATLTDALENCFSHIAVIEALQPYLPTELLARHILDPNRPVEYGSHRPVTVMFIHFYGLEEVIDALGNKEADVLINIINLYFETMSKIIRRYGGTIGRLDTYSIGHRIMALFGALRAHEDDPRRAVLAALDINRALEDVNQRINEEFESIKSLDTQLSSTTVKQRIGINTGFVFAGDVGSDTRREYTVMGDQVNLTARLMSKAQEGEILIGESTARHVVNHLQLEERGSVTVKGISEPVGNYVVSGLKERPLGWSDLGTTPLVGRQRELMQGRLALGRLHEGDGVVMVIRGDSGIGKTRLAEEIASIGMTEGMQVLVGSCLSYGQTMTYHPWEEIFRAYFKIQMGADHEMIENRVEPIRAGMAAIGEEDWTPLIANLLGFDIPDTELTRDLDPKLRRQRVHDLIVKLLQAKTREQPLIVIIDDAHWADPASMDLIQDVIRDTSQNPMLLILAHRSEDDLPDWAAYPHAITTTLGDLPDDACMKIVEGLLGSIKFPEDTCQLMLRKAGGNPLFIGEVLRSMMDIGALHRDADGNWHVIQDKVDLDLPDTVHGIIISRLDRLQSTEQRILQVASVVGSVFGYQTLTEVYAFEDDGENLQDRFDHLQNLGLIALQDSATQTYRFPHLTTQEVVYESLSFDLRRGLHQTIGDYVKSAFTRSLGEKTDLLAYHYYQGQAWPEAMTYNLLAGLNAQREFANESAVESCLRSLQAADKLGPDLDISEEQFAAQEVLGDVLTLMGNYDSALGHYDSARNLVEDALLPEDIPFYLANLHRKTAAVFERQSKYEVALDWLDRGLDYLDLQIPTIEATDIYILKAGVLQRQGLLEQAASWAQVGHDIATQLTTLEGRRAAAHTSYLLGAIYYRSGDLEQAIKHCHDSVRVYEEIDNIVGLARAFNNLGSTYRLKGDWKLAREALQKSLEINRKIGEIQEQGAVTNNLGNIYMNQGDWERATEHFLESHSIWVKLDALLPQAITLSNLAQVYINQGDSTSAETALTESQALFDQIETKGFIAELERRWAELHLLVGDLDEALESVNRSIELAEKQDQPRLGSSLRVLGSILLELREFEKAEAALQKSLALLRDLGSDYEACKTTLSMVELAIACGSGVDRGELNEAREIFSKLGAEADLAKLAKLEGEFNELGL
jgi:class 3 adenylate cyclase/predicted ATPase